MIKEEIKKALGKKIKEWQAKNPKRIYFLSDKTDIKEISEILYRDFKLRFATLTAIDNESNFELLYHFSSDKTGEVFSMRVFIADKQKPEVDSLTGIFMASDWVEREIHELFGINFKGHSNLKHLLLDNDWPKDSYPMRKDYKNE